jgi:transketolase
MFLSADMGAPTLDKFKEECPAQFVHCGISEQNMVNVSVGLSLSGKKVYIYAMSPFFLRCFEQLKLAALHQVPITVVSIGAGLSYAGSGPTHYATEDVACFRTLVNTEVYTVSTSNLAQSIARRSLESEKMMVVRLERGDLPEIYPENYDCKDGYEMNFASDSPFNDGPYVTSGYLVHYLRDRGHRVFDVYRAKPLSPLLIMDLSAYDKVYTVEEQYGAGGLGTAVLEGLNDYGKKTRVFRRFLQERPIYENGNRNELLESAL